LLKQGAYLVNIAGETAWDTEWVIQMVKDGRIAGAALESTSRNLNDFPGNLPILPPLGWHTKESQLRTFEIWYNNIISCVSGAPKNVVSL